MTIQNNAWRSSVLAKSSFAFSLILTLVVSVETATGQEASIPEAPTAASTKRAENDQDARGASAGAKVLVTANRFARDPFDLPRSAESYSGENLHEIRLVRTLPEALRETPGVSVQKTGHSHGSPKIRGQNGYRTLLMVDGIRINTSIWRSGNVEYWNTVDACSLERLELVRGPASVLYGSDAAFGVGQAFSRGPGMPNTWGEEDEVHGRMHLRYASAEDSYVGRVEGRGHHGKQFGWHVGLTYKDFGDMTGGDSLGELPETGYDEVDGDVKLNYALSEDSVLSFGFQHVDWEDTPRTHSTIYAKSWRGTTSGSDFQRDYSQQRSLAYLRLARDTGDLEEEYTVSYQRFAEAEDRIRSNNRRRYTTATVDQYGAAARYVLELDADKRIAFGVEGYYEDVQSDYIEYNADGSVREDRNRGAVADDAYYLSLAAYGQYTQEFGEHWEGTLGARFDYFEADADAVAIAGTSVPAGPFNESWTSLVGSAELIYKPNETTRVWGSLAQSFRAPNLADLTRFDAARSNEVEIPTTDLDPERYLTFELGTRYDDGRRRGSISAFYMWAQDLIVRFPTGNTIGTDLEVTKANAADGWFWGFEAEGALSLDFAGLDEWEFYAWGDYVDSEVDSFDAGDPAETHPKGLPPVSGQFGVRWTSALQDASFELYFPWADGIKASDYNAAERRDTQRIPPDGLPGYVLMGARGSLRVHPKVLASLSIENVANRDYRIMDSGNNGLGTNVIFSVILDL
jgi:hemoglobin/transferrin/lactoferrin receptor protein